jgi:hypothetical protein
MSNKQDEHYQCGVNDTYKAIDKTHFKMEEVRDTIDKLLDYRTYLKNLLIKFYNVHTKEKDKKKREEELCYLLAEVEKITGEKNHVSTTEKSRSKRTTSAKD